MLYAHKDNIIIMLTYLPPLTKNSVEDDNASWVGLSYERLMGLGTSPTVLRDDGITAHNLKKIDFTFVQFSGKGHRGLHYDTL